MNLQLKPVEFKTIQGYFWDFQKKSKCFEIPHEYAGYLGIYQNNELVGYFVVVGYTDKTLEINQGYLTPQFRHKGLAPFALQSLEILAKDNGYKKITLQTKNRFVSYTKFMTNMGYKPERIIFYKEVN